MCAHGAIWHRMTAWWARLPYKGGMRVHCFGVFSCVAVGRCYENVAACVTAAQ